MMESLDDAFKFLNILEKDLTGEDKERERLAREKLISIGKDHESPVIRYAANRIADPETKTNMSYSLKIWLHESSAEDITIIGLCSLLAGLTALFCYESYRILH